MNGPMLDLSAPATLPDTLRARQCGSGNRWRRCDRESLDNALRREGMDRRSEFGAGTCRVSGVRRHCWYLRLKNHRLLGLSGAQYPTKVWAKTKWASYASFLWAC